MQIWIWNKFIFVLLSLEPTTGNTFQSGRTEFDDPWVYKIDMNEIHVKFGERRWSKSFKTCDQAKEVTGVNFQRFEISQTSYR